MVGNMVGNKYPFPRYAMPNRKYPRIKTGFPGVFYRETEAGRVFYILYRQVGERRLIEDRLIGRGWTEARAAAERTRRIEGKAGNAKIKKIKQEKLNAERNRPTLNFIWLNYLDCKGDELRGLATDKNRYEKHIEPDLGNKTPSEIIPLDVERLRRQVAKNHKIGTVRNVLGLTRRIINHGMAMKLSPRLDWTIKLPSVDPDSERIEVLTEEQFQSLQKVWDTYPDQHIVHWHKFIAWTGSRPSEPLRLEWKDIDFKNGFLLKRKTKSGKTVEVRMNDTVRGVLLAQRKLLDSSPTVMRQSGYVFPTKDGGMRHRDSYKRHFQAIRKAAGIPEEYRPNYCLRDTIASRMLSHGSTLDEVAVLLGHEPGSPMTKRYARFIPDAQKRIANQAESVMKGMLENSNDAGLADYGIEA